MPVTTSVIVASHRPEMISACLDALRPQIDATAEVIVATDYDAGELTRKYQWVRWIRCPVSNISAQRNAAVRVAEGAVLAFTDDDCRPCDRWLVSGFEFLQRHPAASAVEGRTVVPPPMSGVWAAALREYRRLERPGFRTSNIMYRTSIFRAAGGFDERFAVQREDMDLAFTVIENGGYIGYEPSMCVEHPLRPGERWDLLKNCWNRRFDPLLYRKHPVNYRHYVGSPFPRAVAAVSCAHALAALAWLAGWQWGAGALCIDAIVVAVLTLRQAHGARLSVGSFSILWIAWLVAPIVLIGALTWGSIRFRRLLLL